MTTEKKIEQPNPFLRAVAGRHSQLVGERELLLTELQLLDDNRGGDNFTESISSMLTKLTSIDSEISTLTKYFAQEGSEKT